MENVVAVMQNTKAAVLVAKDKHIEKWRTWCALEGCCTSVVITV